MFTPCRPPLPLPLPFPPLPLPSLFPFPPLPLPPYMAIVELPIYFHIRRDQYYTTEEAPEKQHARLHNIARLFSLPPVTQSDLFLSSCTRMQVPSRSARSP